MTPHHQLVNQLLLAIALLSTGVVYGTDVFFALVFKKAASLSRDESIADIVGHTHLIADQRMPIIGICAVVSTAIFTTLNVSANTSGIFAAVGLLCLLAHLGLYFTIAKPINSQMSAAAVKGILLPGVRKLQQQWDGIIVYRAALLTVAMLMLIVCCALVGVVTNKIVRP